VPFEVRAPGWLNTNFTFAGLLISCCRNGLAKSERDEKELVSADVISLADVASQLSRSSALPNLDLHEELRCQAIIGRRLISPTSAKPDVATSGLDWLNRV
jgi:hypothetical protein